MVSDSDDSFEDDSLHSKADEKNDDENSIEQLLHILKNFQPAKKKACPTSKSSDKNFCKVLGSTLAITSRIVKRLEALEVENQSLKSRVATLEMTGSSQAKTFASVLASDAIVGSSTPNNRFVGRQSGVGLLSLETKLDGIEQEALANALSIQGPEVDRILSSNRRESLPVAPSATTRSKKSSTVGKPAKIENLTATQKGGDVHIRSEIIDLLKTNCDGTLQDSDISSVNIIGREKKFLKVTLISKYQRDKVLRFIKSRKPKDFYVAEFLTKNRSKLFFRARALRRENECVESVYTRDGAIYCKVANRERPFYITNDEHFQAFLSTVRKE